MNPRDKDHAETQANQEAAHRAAEKARIAAGDLPNTTPGDRANPAKGGKFETMRPPADVVAEPSETEPGESAANDSDEDEDTED